MMAPGSEAPSEMLWYVEEKGMIEAAEDVTHTLHNTYSLRGAKIRDPLAWSKYINDVIGRWGGKANIIIAQHHWPTRGNENVVKLMKSQRDMYRYINDQTLRMANRGLTRDEIAANFKLPSGLEKSWASRGYYGSVSHDVKATYVFYLGWFNGNPATLNELPPVDAAKKYVDYMGGADAIMQKRKRITPGAITVGWRKSLTISSLLIRAIKKPVIWKPMPLNKWVTVLSPVHGVILSDRCTRITQRCGKRRDAKYRQPGYR